MESQGGVPGAPANARGSGYYGQWVLCKPERIRADDGAPLVLLSADTVQRRLKAESDAIHETFFALRPVTPSGAASGMSQSQSQG